MVPSVVVYVVTIKCCIYAKLACLIARKQNIISLSITFLQLQLRLLNGWRGLGGGAYDPLGYLKLPICMLGP